MAAALRFDHVVILVHDLDQASRDYRALGFHVVYGGQHAGGKTHNALIVFQDGTYLELLAPTDPALIAQVDTADRSSFLFMFAQGEGFGGFALGSDDLAGHVAALRARGLDAQMRPPGGRLRSDGVELRWQSATLPGTMTPFFIQDDTPRNLRVPDSTDVVTHENGVKGIIGLTIPSDHLAQGIARYQAILGQPPQPLNPNNEPEPPTYAVFEAPPCRIALDASVKDAPPDIPYQLSLLSPAAGAFLQLDMRLTHGARITLQPF